MSVFSDIMACGHVMGDGQCREQCRYPSEVVPACTLLELKDTELAALKAEVERLRGLMFRMRRRWMRSLKP